MTESPEVIPHDFDEKWLGRLRRIEGEFERAPSDARFMRRFSYVTCLLAAGLLGMGLRAYRDTRAPVALVMAIAMPTMIVLIGVWGRRRAGYRYRFQAGIVQLLAANGKVIWEESLAGIIRVYRPYSHGGGELRVRWPHARHAIELYDTLEEAFDRQEAPRPRHEAVKGVNEPEGPPWRCQACGEESPSQLDRCWKCGKDRAPSGGRPEH